MNSSSAQGGGSRCLFLAPQSIAQFCLLYINTSDEIWANKRLFSLAREKIKGKWFCLELSCNRFFFNYFFFKVKHKKKPIEIILGQINLIWPEAKCQIWFTANFKYQEEILCIRVPCGSTCNMVHAGGLYGVAFIFPTPPQLHLTGCTSLQSQRSTFYLLP